MNLKMSLALIGLSFSASAALADETSGVQTSIGLNANSAYNWRGGQMSAGEPSIGGAVTLSKSGFFGTYGLTRVNLGGADFEHDVVAGYGTQFGDFSLSGGLVKVIFSGNRNGVIGNDLSFGEVFVAGGYKGLNAKLVRNIDAAKANVSRLRNGDVYGELSYMHPLGKGFSAGAEMGYYWYEKSGAAPNVKDGVSQELVKATYQVDKNLSLTANYQFGGKDAFGTDWKHNKRFIVGMSYAF
jgi:uncharacterized protein (TIGR02001 family)